MIIVVILFSVFLPDLVSKSTKRTATNIDTAWISAVKKLEIKVSDSSGDYYQQHDADSAYAYQFDKRKSSYNENTIAKGELFYFDPNTISSSEWRRLGIRVKTIQTIEKYLSKGGHFYKPEDLQKIYGLPKDEYERLAPYVKIEPKDKKINEEFASSKPKDESQPAKTYTSRYSTIDINTGDTSAFISLPGIGSKLALRIVTFREKLGGFYSVEQIGETYGLRDSTFQKIKQWLKLENSSVKMININTATVDEMKTHPYMKFTIANTIVAYRNEHGSFSKVEDIKKVMAVTEEIYKKIVPYLTLQ